MAPTLFGRVIQAAKAGGAIGGISGFGNANDEGALKAVEMDKLEVDELFHRGVNADPDMKRMHFEDLGSSSVQTMEAVYLLIWEHIQAYVPNITASRIAGQNVDLKVTEEDLMGTADINIEFSPVSLNKQAASDMAEWFTKLLANDRTGRIDTGAGVEIIARTYDNALADRIILPADIAAQQIDDQEQGDLAKIVSGQLPPVRKGAEKRRMAKMDEWLQNPKSKQDMAQDPILAKRMQDRYKAYQFTGVIQPRNAAIGATGYDPSQDPVLGDEASQPEMLNQAAA